MKINQNIVRTTPRPGGEAMLRRNVDLAVAGKLRIDDLTPQFGKQVARTFPRMVKELIPFGRVKSVSFLAVDRNGFDVYRVQHEHGMRDWHMLINSDGKVAQAFTREVH